MSFFPHAIVNKGGSPVDKASLNGKVIGLYFSAHWCPPCRMFTPQLARVYQELSSQNKPFEIIFVSSDRSKADFDSYFSSMPWKALPFEDRKAKETLSAAHSIRGIPSLILLEPDGSVLSTDGRGLVMRLGAAGFPYGAKQALGADSSASSPAAAASSNTSSNTSSSSPSSFPKQMMEALARDGFSEEKAVAILGQLRHQAESWLMDNQFVYPPPPLSEGPQKMVFVVNKGLKMGVGKVAAQCGHASLMAYRNIQEGKAPQVQKECMRSWLHHGQAKIVLGCKDVAEMKRLERDASGVGLPTTTVQDAGRTQIAAGSFTVLAIGPGPKGLIDLITGRLKLL